MAAFNSPRVRVRRHPERGVYEPATVKDILDEALYCHVAFVHNGLPQVIPTIHARVGDVLYLHGSPKSRLMRSGADGIEICVTATIVDGLVLARAVFGHSLNYRSAVVLGRARAVSDRDEKRKALHAVVEHVLPTRSTEARPPTDAELIATGVLALPLDEASAKIRTGPPIDTATDVDSPIWAGVVALRTVPGAAEPSPDLHDGIALPPSVQRYLTSAAR